MYRRLVDAQHISSTAEEEMKVEEDIEKAGKPLDTLDRIVTGSMIEHKEVELRKYSNYQLIRKVSPLFCDSELGASLE
jgi:hypothetical protein